MRTTNSFLRDAGFRACDFRLRPAFTNKPSGSATPSARSVATTGLRTPGREESVSCPGRSTASFTLIEVIAILTVIVLLALALVPSLIRQLDRAASEKEQSLLAEFAEAIEKSARRNRYLPGPTNWASIVAAETGLDAADVATNGRGSRRAFLVDPSIQVGVNGGVLPYRQTMAGSVVTSGGSVIPPVNPRVLLVSSIGTALPAAITNGVPTAADFNAIWTNAQDMVPTGSAWTSWPGRGEDVKVQRLDMSALFMHVFLYNFDPSTNSPQLGYFSVDRLGTNQVPYNFTNNVGIDFFLLQGTVLTLLLENGVTVDSEQIINRNATFVFEKGVWRGSIFEGQRLTGLNIELTADLFLASPWNRNASAGVRQSEVVNALIAFMNAYETWAALGTWPKGSDPIYQALKNAQSTMSQKALQLMNSPVGGQCQ